MLTGLASTFRAELNTAKPELVCPVEVFRRSLLPVGRIDLAVEAPGYSDSGFALACTAPCWLFRLRLPMPHGARKDPA